MRRFGLWPAIQLYRRCMRFLPYATILVIAAAPLTALAQARPVSTVANSATAAQAYFEFQVEKPVLPLATNPRPQYPDVPRVRARGGEVEVRFVVDTNGHADMTTFEALTTTDESISTSVRDVLPEMRFYPAESNGHKVRQLVQQVFRFAPIR
jgi:outer membrane biosynthesis protein TonB